LLAANLTLGSIACRHAIRLAVAATVALALARALRLPHGYWVPLTALWLLRPDFGSTFTRGVQRYAGTTAGAVLATLFAATVHPGPYALATLATALQRLHAAQAVAQRQLDADDPLQQQANVMIAAVDDAVTALRQLVRGPEQRSVLLGR
jgi:hypothetical protein